MDEIYSQIKETFEIQEFPHAMFYEFDHALRFELGGGEEFGTNRSMRRFMQAHERANAISHSLFSQSTEIYLLLSSFGLEQPTKKRLKPLKQCGLKRSNFTYLGRTAEHDDGHIAEFGSDHFRHWDIARLTGKETVSEILLLGIASEMAITPSFRHLMTAYVVDVDNGLILHLYDDRGMDVVAVHKAPLEDLFYRYTDWLLEYDIARMTEFFGCKG